MANDLIEFDVIKNGIRKIRDRAENGIRRITADFLVNNFFEDIETMKKRGYSFDEILDELNIMLADVIPDKSERDKMFAIKSGTLKVYMSRKRKQLAEDPITSTSKMPARKQINKKKVSESPKQKEPTKAVMVEPKSKITKPANVPTGRARATDLDREI